MPKKINIDEKFAMISEQFRPKIVAELNGQEFKLVKAEGAYPWHSHTDADEMFFIWRGNLTLEFRTHSVDLSEGEALVIPKGVEHRPIAHGEVQLFLIEPKATKNNGGTKVDEKFDAPNDVWI